MRYFYPETKGRLERSLGVPLAVRRGRGIEITGAGRALVASGLAVATLPALALRASRNDNVSIHPIERHPPRRVLALTRRNAQQVAAVRATLDTLRAAAGSSGS